jgi:hypothetical protein
LVEAGRGKVEDTGGLISDAIVTVPVYTFVVVVMGCVPPMAIAGDFVEVVMVCTLLVVGVGDFVFGGRMD